MQARAPRRLGDDLEKPSARAAAADFIHAGFAHGSHLHVDVQRQASQRVVANRAEEVQGEEQTAWIVDAEGAQRVQGKGSIAAALADRLEGMLGQPKDLKT